MMCGDVLKGVVMSTPVAENFGSMAFCRTMLVLVWLGAGWKDERVPLRVKVRGIPRSENPDMGHPANDK